MRKVIYLLGLLQMNVKGINLVTSPKITLTLPLSIF